jgi:hypothetical protein
LVEAEKRAETQQPAPAAMLRELFASGRGLDSEKAKAYTAEVYKDRKHWRGECSVWMQIISSVVSQRKDPYLPTFSFGLKPAKHSVLHRQLGMNFCVDPFQVPRLRP